VDVVARAGAALEGVVLGDTVEPVVVPQPAVWLTVVAWGMLMVVAPMRVAAASKAAVDVGRMVIGLERRRGQKGKGRRVIHTRCLFCEEGARAREERRSIREGSRHAGVIRDTIKPAAATQKQTHFLLTANCNPQVLAQGVPASEIWAWA
jgi:hypothetical protein